MAKPEEIPTDLTLELNGDLSPDRFLTAARAFFGVVQEIAKAVVPEGDQPAWKVLTKEGSNLLGLAPEASVNAVVAKAVYDRVRLGINQIAFGVLVDQGLDFNAPALPVLPEPAIQHLKTLADIAASKSRRNPVSVRVWVEKQPTEIEAQISRTITESMGENYRDYGTVEGTLNAIQDKGNLQIRVYDPILRQGVVCHVTDEMLPDVFSKFRKRVEVSGVIHYRRNGTPISIDVENIEELPDDTDLPSVAEVRGILAS